MEHIKITGLPFDASRIGLGTWAIGGWLWGGTEESDAIKTIHAALDNGINLIDTAPVYGFGRSEELVGKALQGGRQSGRDHCHQGRARLGKRQDLAQLDTGAAPPGARRFASPPQDRCHRHLSGALA